MWDAIQEARAWVTTTIRRPVHESQWTRLPCESMFGAALRNFKGILDSSLFADMPRVSCRSTRCRGTVPRSKSKSASGTRAEHGSCRRVRAGDPGRCGKTPSPRQRRSRWEDETHLSSACLFDHEALLFCLGQRLCTREEGLVVSHSSLLPSFYFLLFFCCQLFVFLLFPSLLPLW